MGIFPVPVEPSMEALPVASRIRQLYPEDLFPNGRYVQLPYGRMRYWILGPEEGTKVVLIHGISTPAITWKVLAPYLAEQGFRVLVYDLYGKGYSEAPLVTYDSTFFAVQLALLLQYIRWPAANIVGFSMGGGVAAAFAATLPHLVAGKLVLISSAGLIEDLRAPNPSVRVPIPQYEELRDLQASELPGYKRSLQSCFVDGPIRGQEAAFDKLASLTVGPAQQRVQVLVVHGTDDEIVPVGEVDKIKARIPQAEILKVDGAQHDVVLNDAHWQRVAQELVRFLQ
ncbi:alpha/beta-hydrolase [Trametes coccinea BRFM310]|uniref:Alpha/beta-hydrolase n=1 Tax=Trametes coccinea (strain BRFM310) TaxID=1353009 RepID=A0A1Y2IQV0_TRAC3|nr:alpha/beta-hydrolase [Trametes coccinea BRFM310]